MIFALFASAATAGTIDERGLVWLVGAIFALPSVLWCVNLALSIRQKLSPNPPATEKYRHVKDCEHLCQANLDAHEKLDREMNERLSAMSGHSAESRKEIYIGIRKLSEDVAALKATDEHQTQQLYALEAKIDRIWETLRNDR